MYKRCCATSCYNSVTTNRDVEYFGFPKSMHYATAWAMAAGRDDLLTKNINSIIKYALCSEHFTDECFLDPPNNRRLRKKMRPMYVPIPTIFENNFTECVTRKLLKNRKATPPVSLSETSSNNLTIATGTRPLEVCQLAAARGDVNTRHEQADTASIRLIIEPVFCRLCLSIDSKETFINIYDDNNRIDVPAMLDTILPNMISKDDNLPQVICSQCLASVTSCVTTIDNFRMIQQSLRVARINNE